jgi:hypothetical protein
MIFSYEHILLIKSYIMISICQEEKRRQFERGEIRLIAAWRFFSGYNGFRGAAISIC